MTAATAQRPRLRLTMPEPTEQQCLNAIRAALLYHPAVAWCERVNNGMAWGADAKGRKYPIRFNTIVGCSDLIGQLKRAYGGRLVAVEAKRPSTRNGATDAQRAFLAQVRDAGGIAFVAASATEAIEELERQLRMPR